MFSKPRQTRFDRGRLKLRCDYPRWHRRVVNFDNSRQVRLNSVADNKVHGLCFLLAACEAEGELFRVELTGTVADGVAVGNAKVGDDEAEADGVNAVDE